MDFSGKIPARFLRTAPIRVRGGEVEASAPEMKIDPAGIHSKVKRMRMERTGVTAGVGGRGQMCP